MFDMYPLPAAPVHEFAVADPCPAAGVKVYGVKVYKVVFFCYNGIVSAEICMASERRFLS